MKQDVLFPFLIKRGARSVDSRAARQCIAGVEDKHITGMLGILIFIIRKNVGN